MLDVRIAPYDRPADVADPPLFKPYRESFARGAFADALKAPKRIMLDHAHRPGLRDVLGFAIRLDDRADGLHGTFQLLDDAAATRRSSSSVRACSAASPQSSHR